MRTIAVLFASDATISSEKMIKGSILSVIVRPTDKTLATCSSQKAGQRRVRNAAVEKWASKQRDRLPRGFRVCP